MSDVFFRGIPISVSAVDYAHDVDLPHCLVLNNFYYLAWPFGIDYGATRFSERFDVRKLFFQGDGTHGRPACVH